MFAREFAPHEWRPLEELRRTYDAPLDLLVPQQAAAAASAPRRQTILLEYLRDEDAKQYEESNPFLFEQDRVRQVVIGNCRLLDPKLEKNGNFEFVPKVSKRLNPTNFVFDFFRAKIPTSNVTT